MKIAQYGMGLGHTREADANSALGVRTPNLPHFFEDLQSNEYFSVGQDSSYYEALNALGPVTRDEVLTSLNDLALSEGALQRALLERVTRTSLLRAVSQNTVEGQFRRMARGGARLSEYRFTYSTATPKRSDESISLSFEVLPESHPPTNIHVLIGRNGVGKTRLLTNMSRALVLNDEPKDVGAFVFEESSGGEDEANNFSNLVSVSFSAFDSIDPVRSKRAAEIRSHYIGLKRFPTAENKTPAPKSPDGLARDFSLSMFECLKGERQSRWKRALKLLESDPVFADAEVAALAEDFPGQPEDELRARALFLFKEKLSSGHKIVLLTVTRLVETVEERSLVLLDEPEAHLHPPLLAAFVRALSDLLVNRNGVAVIATHSPVVLQEVPRTCVYVLQRSGRMLSVDRPRLETFGENVGLLTHEVFGLEVTKSGFHRMLTEAMSQDSDYDEVLERFHNQLGGEARSIVRGLIATRDQET